MSELRERDDWRRGGGRGGEGRGERGGEGRGGESGGGRGGQGRGERGGEGRGERRGVVGKQLHWLGKKAQFYSRIY